MRLLRGVESSSQDEGLEIFLLVRFLGCICQTLIAKALSNNSIHGTISWQLAVQ